MKGCTTPPGSYAPYTLYEQQCGFFYVLQEQWKSCETLAKAFHETLNYVRICYIDLENVFLRQIALRSR